MRRMAIRCFNEQNNKTVWSETIQVAHDVLAYWASKRAMTHSADDLRTLSLHVLSRSGSASLSSNYKESL
jgi:hypothetical protein